MAMVDETGGGAPAGASRWTSSSSAATGCRPSAGFTTPYRAEVAIKQAMMACARRVVMMFDHSKVGNEQLFRFATDRRGGHHHHGHRGRRRHRDRPRGAGTGRHPCLSSSTPGRAVRDRASSWRGRPRTCGRTCLVRRPDVRQVSGCHRLRQSGHGLDRLPRRELGGIVQAAARAGCPGRQCAAA